MLSRLASPAGACLQPLRSAWPGGVASVVGSAQHPAALPNTPLPVRQGTCMSGTDNSTCGRRALQGWTKACGVHDRKEGNKVSLWVASAWHPVSGAWCGPPEMIAGVLPPWQCLSHTTGGSHSFYGEATSLPMRAFLQACRRSASR